MKDKNGYDHDDPLKKNGKGLEHPLALKMVTS